MLPLHCAQMAALLCPLVDGALLDVHADEHGQVQPARVRSVRAKDGHNHFVNYH